MRPVIPAAPMPAALAVLVLGGASALAADTVSWSAVQGQLVPVEVEAPRDFGHCLGTGPARTFEVVVRFDLQPDGTARDARAVRATDKLGCFADSAELAVRRSTFEPITRDGRVVTVEGALVSIRYERGLANGRSVPGDGRSPQG